MNIIGAFDREDLLARLQMFATFNSNLMTRDARIADLRTRLEGVLSAKMRDW